MTIVNVNNLRHPDSFTIEELIKQHFNVDISTTKPLDVKQLSQRIGTLPSLLIVSMLTRPNCSTYGVECFIKVLEGIADNGTFGVHYYDHNKAQTRPFNFKLTTSGFLLDENVHINESLDESDYAQLVFTFIPEYKISKSFLREDITRNGSFDLDLKIDCSLVVWSNSFSSPPKGVCEEILVASVVVEFDGPNHLKDETVRADKLRDSMIQSTGSTVFRIQTPYLQSGPGSVALNRQTLDNLIKGQIEDIKNHFRNKLFNLVSTSYLLRQLIERKRNNSKNPDNVTR